VRFSKIILGCLANYVNIVELQHWNQQFFIPSPNMLPLLSRFILFVPFSQSLTPGLRCSKSFIWIRMIHIWKSYVLLSRIRWFILFLICQFFKAILDWITLNQLKNFKEQQVFLFEETKKRHNTNIPFPIVLNRQTLHLTHNKILMNSPLFCRVGE